MVVFLILIYAIGNCQESDFVSGILIDSETIEPVAFASIRVKNKAVGVISNIDGSFRVPLKFRALNDTLEVTSMGYESREIVITNLVTENLNRLYLNPMLIQLDEVTLKASKRRRSVGNARKVRDKPISAKEIVALAIEKIPENYPFVPYSYVGYYRDYQRKAGGYTNLNEAIVEVFDKGFGTSDYEESDTRIYEYTRNTDFPTDSLSERLYDYNNKTKIIPRAFLKSYGGNEFVILRIMDAIRNYNTFSYSYVDQLDNDFLKNHNFSLEDDTSLDGKALYVVDIYKQNGKIMVRGKIYISNENYQIFKLEYATYDASVGSRKLRKTSKKIEDRLLYRTVVEYKEQDNKMFPSYVSCSNKFQVKVPPVFTVKNAFINFEKKRFEIVFNRVPLHFKVFKKKNYNISYKGRDIDIDNIALKDSTTVLVNPKLNLGDQALQVFYADPEDIGQDDFRIVMDNIIDLEGNNLDNSGMYSLMQFREFFVQQQKPIEQYPEERLLMNKNWPIFQDQPIVKPYNYGDFWMNTPLLNEGAVPKQ